ncbi:hypothetical protein [Nostoc foliaceum]|nr:hypothetical protein [Nostoc foliaceum]
MTTAIAFQYWGVGKDKVTRLQTFPKRAMFTMGFAYDGEIAQL